MNQDVDAAATPSPPGAPSYLRAARRAAGLSQQQLAERADLAVRTISIIESGQSNPRATTLTAIANALGVDATGLIGAFATNSTPSVRGATRSDATSDRHVQVATSDLARLFDTVNTLIATGDLDSQALVRQTARLFTAYATGLVEHALANPTTHSPETIAGLIRLQRSQFPDDSDDRKYLDWLLGDADGLSPTQQARYEDRRAALLS